MESDFLNLYLDSFNKNLKEEKGRFKIISYVLIFLKRCSLLIYN